MASTITKLRSFHVADMAVFDWVATGIGAALLSRAIYKSPSPAQIAGIFILLIVSAIILHIATGTPTMLNAYLGLAKKEDVYAARANAERG